MGVVVVGLSETLRVVQVPCIQVAASSECVYVWRSERVVMHLFEELFVTYIRVRPKMSESRARCG